MRRRLVPAADDLAGEVRLVFDGASDHERRQLDAALVHQVEHARDALGVAVGEKRVGRQVGQPSLDRFGQEPPAPEMGWPPASNISDRLTAMRAPFGQKSPASRAGARLERAPVRCPSTPR